jgi:hypothetical protein
LRPCRSAPATPTGVAAVCSGYRVPQR